MESIFKNKRLVKIKDDMFMKGKIGQINDVKKDSKNKLIFEIYFENSIFWYSEDELEFL